MKARGSRLTRLVQGLLGLGVLLSIALLVSDFIERSFLQQVVGGEVSSRVMDELAAEHELRQGLLALISLALGCLTGITALVWIHRAHVSAQTGGGAEISTSPGWAVGWFFVPIANLWKPYVAMWELWRHHHPIGDGGAVEGGALLRCWWGFWLLSSALAYLTLRSASLGAIGPSPLEQNFVAIAADATAIPLHLVFFAMVRRLDRARRLPAV